MSGIATMDFGWRLPKSLKKKRMAAAVAAQRRRVCERGSCAGCAVVVAALMVLTSVPRPRKRRAWSGGTNGGAIAAEPGREEQDCKAGDEKTRAEYRQEKRDTKQQGRHDGGQNDPASATNPAQ